MSIGDEFERVFEVDPGRTWVPASHEPAPKPAQQTRGVRAAQVLAIVVIALACLLSTGIVLGLLAWGCEWIWAHVLASAL